MIKKVVFIFLLIFLYHFSLSAEPAAFVVPIAGEFTSTDESVVLYVDTETGDNLLVFYMPDAMSTLRVKIENSLGSTLWEGETNSRQGVYFPEAEFSKVIISPVGGVGRWACALINKTEYEKAGYGYSEGEDE